MSTGSPDWTPWVDYVLGYASNNYFDHAPADNASVWNVQIGGLEAGDCYAKSQDFDHTFDSVPLKKLSEQSAGKETDIFSVPPKDYTIVKAVDCVTNQGEIKVLAGKCKTKPGRMLYVANGQGTCIIALVDITNCNRGVEGIALNAFAYGVSLALENGI